LQEIFKKGEVEGEGQERIIDSVNMIKVLYECMEISK
jgi:hypothetical protein